VGAAAVPEPVAGRVAGASAAGAGAGATTAATFLAKCTYMSGALRP